MLLFNSHLHASTATEGFHKNKLCPVCLLVADKDKDCKKNGSQMKSKIAFSTG